MVFEGEKQEKGRRRGKGDEISHAVTVSRNANIREIDIRQDPASAPQSYPSALILFLPKSKDTRGTANCAHLTQKPEAFSYSQEVLPTSYISM